MLRILAKIFALVLLCGIGVGAFFLVPAHLQVRRVHPALPTIERLKELHTRADGPVALRYVNTSEQATAHGVLAHSVWLVEWPDRRLFMIDAGMDREGAVSFGELMQTLGEAEDPVVHGSVAELLGDDISAVQGVGFTHLHIDHTQGIPAFCRARGPGALVYQSTWQASTHNLHTREGAAIVADSCLEARTVPGEGLLEIDGWPGLALVPLGGHTPGSTAFVFAVAGKLWVFSGDTTNRKSDLLANVGKGILYSYFIVPEDTGRTEELRLWLASLDAEPDTEVVVSHDLASIEASTLKPWQRRD